MAPIHGEQSYSLHSSSSTMSPLSCLCRRALSDDWEWFLPITRRGHFFQDSFFENARSHFDTAVRDVLGRWSDSSMLTDTSHDTANNFSRYRQLRSRNLKEENQAVTVSSDDNSDKIVLDVHDFMDGDVKVKVIGEKEVLVEGYIENKKEGESSVSSQKFSRRFIIPEDTNLEGITSVMSADGVLTVTIPKKNSTKAQEGVRVILHKEASSSNATQASKSAAKSVQESYGATSKCTEAQAASNGEKYCENCCKKLISEKKVAEKSDRHEETRIPVQNYSTQQMNETKSHNTSFLAQNQTESAGEKKCDSYLSNQASSKKSSESNNISTQATGENTLSRIIPISVFSSLPVTRRGLFFNDSIFENSRNDFLSAVREVLSRWGERSSLMDDLTCYRNLRTRDLREENQAVKVKEEEGNHKFVLDVHDFMNGGEVNVKAINDREIVVEGHIERQEGGAKSIKRFFKRFTVPSDIRLDSVSSVMSSDGVLTITAPKKPPTIHIRDVTSPIRTENVQEASAERKLESDVKNMKISQSSAVTSTNSERESCQSTSSKLHNSSASSESHHSSSANHGNSTNEYIIPVHLEGMSKEVRSDYHSQTVKNSNDLGRNHEKMTENSETSATQNVSSVNRKTESGAEQNRREIKIMQNNASNSDFKCSTPGRFLPLARRGPFSTDSFFEDSRRNFQTAVRGVLLKFNENNHSDDLSAYRELRQRNLTFENQAFDVHEDDHRQKVVVDARDFIDGDITVSIVGEKELVIEGRTENKKDTSSSTLTFCRRVLLPESVDMNSITSAISSDGVLTVESLKTNTSSNLSNIKKMSSEAHSKQESRSDSGHRWEEKSVKESSEQSEGCSSHTLSKSYRSHQEHATTNVF